jgi:hypothetical protein
LDVCARRECGAEEVAPDTSEPVDTYPDGHAYSLGEVKMRCSDPPR